MFLKRLFVFIIVTILVNSFLFANSPKPRESLNTSSETQSTTLYILKGWNLLGALTTATPDKYFGSYSSIWTYEGGQWSKNPSTLKQGNGFWIASNLRYDVSWDYIPFDITGWDEGWNLLGAGKQIDVSRLIQNGATAIWTYDTSGKWIKNPQKINASEGFWLNASKKYTPVSISETSNTTPSSNTDTTLENPFGEWLNSGLDKLPLDILNIHNQKMAELKFKSGDSFPDLDHYNLVILGPLATAKDGTKGPLLKVKGEGQFLGESFGNVNFTGSASGLSGVASAHMNINLGSVKGTDLGSIGGNMLMRISAGKDEQKMSLEGEVKVGPFSGAPLKLDLSYGQMNYNLPGSCLLPFSVFANANLNSIEKLSNLSFEIDGELSPPSFSDALGCAGDIFALLKNGILYLSSPGGQVIELAQEIVPPVVMGFADDASGFMLSTGPSGVGLVTQAVPIKNIPVDHLAGPTAAIVQGAVGEAVEVFKNALELVQAKELANLAANAIGASFQLASGLASGAIELLKDFGYAIQSLGSALFGGGSSIPAFGWQDYNDAGSGLFGIDVSQGHDFTDDGQCDRVTINGMNLQRNVWMIGTDHRPYQRTSGQAGYDNTRFTKRDKGLFQGVQLIKIEADYYGGAVAIAKDGALWKAKVQSDSIPKWFPVFKQGSRVIRDYAMDIGIGGGIIYKIGVEPKSNGYAIYSAYYYKNDVRFNWSTPQYGNQVYEEYGDTQKSYTDNFGGIRIDVGGNGIPWVIDKEYKIYRYYNGGSSNYATYHPGSKGWYYTGARGSDITVTQGNRAYMSSMEVDPNHGGYTYKYYDDKEGTDWERVEGWAWSLGSGCNSKIWRTKGPDDRLGEGSGSYD